MRRITHNYEKSKIKLRLKLIISNKIDRRPDKRLQIVLQLKSYRHLRIVVKYIFFFFFFVEKLVT